MWQHATDGIIYLTSQSHASLFELFWFVIIFEFPRYTLSFLSVAAISFRRTMVRPHDVDVGRVTAVIVGHNEAETIERCVRSFREQSRPPDEIIVVSDGSTDQMPAKLRALQKQGLIAEAHCVQLRAGKAAACNLGFTRASGAIIVNVDCDCVILERHALSHLCQPFVDRKVGAVAGNIVVRNSSASLIASFQAIEYLISISQGKQAANLTDQMTCVSGAFGAFRRAALESVGGLDSGGGEDLDVTLRLRAGGWTTHFASDAICLTSVPTTVTALTQQRFRWERDAVRLRYRKHRDLMNPFSARFKLVELLHEMDFVLFNVVAAIAFPFYLIWLFVTYGDLAPAILFGAQVGMLVLDTFTFLLAAWLTPQVKAIALAPYLIGYSLFYGLIMRFIRLAAYLQEWVFRTSYRDSYVPMKVHRVRR
jgi:cellulose synthase/poly-beta-1,6-N-acetylglucosamine synthase-like glycosyltransferase